MAGFRVAFTNEMRLGSSLYICAVKYFNRATLYKENLEHSAALIISK